MHVNVQGCPNSPVKTPVSPGCRTGSGSPRRARTSLTKLRSGSAAACGGNERRNDVSTVAQQSVPGFPIPSMQRTLGDDDDTLRPALGAFSRPCSSHGYPVATGQSLQLGSLTAVEAHQRHHLTPPGLPDAQLALLGGGQDSPHCSITTDGDGAKAQSEIRTKVFRIGAPLLRSTIPVSLGRSSAITSDLDLVSHAVAGEEDVETVLSLSDIEVEDQGRLSVTLDFPC